MARWRHNDTHVLIESADTLRVVLSLGGTQNVSHARADRIARSTSRAGDVGILPPDASSTTTVEGDADILQIFVEPEALGVFPGAQFAREPFGTSASEDLRASAARLFVTAHKRAETGSEHAASALMATVRDLLSSGSTSGGHLRKGGLPPEVMRRLDRMIFGRIETPDTSALRIQDLADETRLSVNHLVRAFRQTTSTTPHQ